jgi:2-C-methyl-D-erythritol 4-phosphate cytidylyltransferase
LVTAIIVAAGSGSRMGTQVPKQLLPLAGLPLVEHSLAAFQRHDGVDRVILVIAPERRSDYPLGRGRHPKLEGVVDGGETRQGSVSKGLEAAGDADLVLVHDAARPFPSARLIGAVIEAARRSGAAVPACRVGDTVKRVDGACIEATVPRQGLVQVQTPQAFRTSLLRRAHRAARRDGFVGTDDAQLVERLGEPVAWVEGSRLNLKITTPEDLELAEALVRGGAVVPD